MDKREILEKFDFFADADRARRQEIEEGAKAVSLSPGDFYFHEGDVCSSVALIGRGDVRVYKSGESGREITLYHVRSGETCFLTASCLLANIDYPASAVADIETDALLFSSSLFQGWLGDDNLVQNFIFKTLSLRISEVMSLIEEICFNKMDKRLSEYLLQRFKNDGSLVREIECTHEQIALELGSAREVISRILQELKRSGAIELARKKITLKDIDKLSAMIDT